MFIKAPFPRLFLGLSLLVLVICGGCRERSRLCPRDDWTSFTADQGLERDWQHALAVDDQGHLWAGDISGSLIIYDGKRWSRGGMALSFTGSPVNDLEWGPEGEMWVAFQSGVVAAVGEEKCRTFDLREGRGDLRVYDLAVDSHGDPFAATSRGLFHFHLGAWKEVPPPDRNRQFSFKSLAFDQEGYLWAGEKYGLYRFRNGRWRSFTKAAGREIMDVTAIDVLPEGELWLGTGFGVFHRTGQQWTYFNEEDGLPGNWVRTLAVGSEGQVWIGTMQGAAVYDGVSWQKYPEGDGLVDPRVGDIVADPAGAVWFATQGGISCFNPGE